MNNLHGGAFTEAEGYKNGTVKLKEIYIKEVLYRNPATIVFWSDGTKTVSKCSKNDQYSPDAGLMCCCMKKLFGSKQVRMLVDDWVPENVNETSKITLREVRKKKMN